MTRYTSLTNHFLIAMPNLAGSAFHQSLVYIFEHHAQGAMGLIINQTSGLNLADILEQLRPEEPVPEHTKRISVYTGGPVQMEHGFVLHSNEQNYQQTANLGNFSLTTSRDILFAIADGNGPEKYIIALGYAGWGEGQLESELKENAWLSCPAEHTIIFNTPIQEKRTAAAASLGIQLSQLSPHAGHA